jgi:predicted nucleic acid-binding protein
MIVLDTSVLSLAFRRVRGEAGAPPVVVELRRLVATDAALAVPGIVLQELLSGVRSTEQFRRLAGLLDGFPLLFARKRTHLAAAQVANACRQGGIAASTADCLIAAHAIDIRGRLFTVDSDFGAIAGCSTLRMHDWE